MKQKYELFFQDGAWSDYQDEDIHLEIYVMFTNEICEQIEECHGFQKSVFYNNIEIVGCEINGLDADILELDDVWQELNELNLNNFQEI